MEMKITEEQFNIKYDKYHKMIYNIAYTYFKNYDDACDVIQEVFIKYLKQGNFKSEQYERHWLIRVTINVCKNEVKRKKKQINLNDETINNLKDDYTEKEYIFHQISQLDDKYKVVIILHYYNNLPIKEIAEILKVSESCIKMRLKRGKEMLKGKDGNYD